MTGDGGGVTTGGVAGARDGSTAAAPTRSTTTCSTARAGDGWVVASAGDYPAKPGKVEEVVGKLVDLKVRNPIATQNE